MDISSTSPLTNVNAETTKLEKGIKTALALKITAIALAVLLVAFTITAVFFLPAAVVIGAGILTGLLLISALAAVIAGEVLLKKKGKAAGAAEKLLLEKNQKQEQTIQNFMAHQENRGKVFTTDVNLILSDLEKVEKLRNEGKKVEITTQEIDSSKIPEDLVEI